MLSLVIVCCFGVLQTSGSHLAVHTDKELEVFRTNSLELRCSFGNVPPTALSQVSWYRLNDDGSPGSAFITSIHGEDVHVEERQEELGLEGRVSIQPDGLSLNITDTFLHDEGIYRCEVTVLQPFLETNSSDVQLSVVDYQIRGYVEGVVFAKGAPVTLTAIVSGSHLLSQNSWTVNGNRPPPNSVSDVTLKRLDGRWTVTSTLTFQNDTTVTVVFKSYIPLPRSSMATHQPWRSENSRTVLVQMAIFFEDTNTRSQFALFAAAEAWCTIAATVLVLIVSSLHICYKVHAGGWYYVGYTLIVILFLGVVIGIPVYFFAVQKVRMDADIVVAIVFSATAPFLFAVALGIAMCDLHNSRCKRV